MAKKESTPSKKTSTKSAAASSSKKSPDISQQSIVRQNDYNFGLLLGGAAVIVIGLGIFGFSYFKRTLVDPLILLGTSFTQLAEAESVQAELTAINGELTSSMIFSEVGLSAVDVDFTVEGQEYAFNSRFSEDDLYLQTEIEDVDRVFADLFVMLPQLSQTQTVALLRPILSGEAWLHIADLSAMTQDYEEEETVDEDWWAGLSKEEQEFFDALRDSVIISEFSNNYQYEGQKHSYVALGLDKEKFLVAIDKMKELDVDVKVSQINEIKAIITETDGWDQNLVEVVVSAENYPVYMKVSVPELNEEQLEKSLEEIAQDDSGSMPWLQALPEAVSDIVDRSSTQETTLVELFEIKMMNFNTAPVVEVPSPTQDFTEVMFYAQQEILPLFGQMMMQAGQVPTAPTSQGLPPASAGFNSPYDYPTEEEIQSMSPEEVQQRLELINGR